MMECMQPLFYGDSISIRERKKIQQLLKKDPIVMKDKWGYIIMRESKPFLMEYITANELNERNKESELICLLGIVKNAHEFKTFVLSTVSQVVQAGQSITQEHIIMQLEGVSRESL